MEEKNKECGEEAVYFHSKCCNAHFEGVIIGQRYFAACEKCGKIVGQLNQGGQTNGKNE